MWQEIRLERPLGDRMGARNRAETKTKLTLGRWGEAYNVHQKQFLLIFTFFHPAEEAHHREV